MNNVEKIKNMSIDEMAEYFATHTPKACFMCEGMKLGCLRQVSCEIGIKNWLESEVENAR